MYKLIVLIELKLEIKEDLVQKKKLFKFLDPPQLLFFPIEIWLVPLLIWKKKQSDIL